jgi:hypothetical protein
MWHFRDTELKTKEDFINLNCHGIVYMIEFEDNTRYIGKFSLYSIRRSKPLKNGRTREGHIRYKAGMEEYLKMALPFDYVGSFVKANYQNNNAVSKRVIGLAKDKRHLTYLEAKYQFQYNVLERDDFRNSNILGKFFKVEKDKIEDEFPRGEI